MTLGGAVEALLAVLVIVVILLVLRELLRRF